ncbi:MAG TPA: hypothetical protein VN673_09290, partial [Clostridia bacterium]|nr:hypothetical protein [Clostridia bacterium]
TTATITLTPVPDTLVEGLELVTVSVTANAAYTIGTAASATATIVDDELTSGTMLFADTFDIYDNIFNWNMNYGGYDAYAESGYDYSVHGIPEAPNSTGTYQPTRGLKLDVNRSGQADCGFSMSPMNASFTGDYRLRFDAWINFNGPLSGGGPASSEFLSAGVGTTGVEPVWNLGTATEGVWFAVDGDGGFLDTGVPGDFQAWTGSTLLLANSGAYAGGTAADVRGNFHPYYSPWGGMAAPAQQVTDYPTAQTGTTDAGTLGMAWHSFVITRQGTNVTWDVDGLRIAKVNISGLTLSTNILLGYSDQFQSAGNGDQPLRFAIVDNVKVETLPPPPAAEPEIAFIQLINNGTQVQIDFSGSVGELASAFTLQAATDVAGSFADVTATITAQGGNKFRAVRAVNGATQFYRVRR